jgi:hypothetical protein
MLFSIKKLSNNASLVNVQFFDKNVDKKKLFEEIYPFKEKKLSDIVSIAVVQTMLSIINHPGMGEKEIEDMFFTSQQTLDSSVSSNSSETGYSYLHQL